ncbi:MAG TPA: acyltransferase [Hymenobacter sp.]|jgi:peptidoglycan/LPS O-acetylase OafA/YrhL|uniref:acyltransferase family protein n=1 Tax=Hymenobacter sp. TaxID=1898978 RepID=UPI002ED85D95
MPFRLPKAKKGHAAGAAGHRRIYGLDLFRTTAIVLVIVSHFARPLQILGVLGVELFFVLSGYLIGGLFLRQVLATPHFGWAHLYDFLQRRWIRTLPNYYLFFLVHLALSSILGSTTPAGMALYAVFLQNLAWPVSSFYSVSWSLAIEEWFYLLFPAAVFGLLRWVSKPAAFLIVIALLVLVPLGIRLGRPALSWEFGMRMVVACRVDALMFGVALAVLRHYLPAAWPRLRYLFLPGLVLAAVNLALLHRVPESQPAPYGAWVFSLLPLACAAMLPWVESLTRPAKLVAAGVESISKWSYSIYLSHIPVLFVCYHVTDPFHLGFGGKLLVKAVALAAIVGLSKVVYERFEVPLMKLRDRKVLLPVAQNPT